MANFYNGSKLLSLKDINGDQPEIYICTSNRSAGKTTFFSKLLVDDFINKGEKFALIYRFNYELDSVADKFFKDINTLFFPEYTMISKRHASGIYHELYLGKTELNKDVQNFTGECCGYAITLNSADQLKKYGHFFSDTKKMLFDEFQSETNHYCSDEVNKLKSVHTTVARGQGKHVRYVPVYMVGNPVTLLNPYYVEMGITDRLRSNTKFLRGEGFVMEQGFVESAAKAQQESGFNRAFGTSQYNRYASQGVYLNDNTAFIEKPVGKSTYLGTIKYMGKDYALRSYNELGIVYCDKRADLTFKQKLAVTTEDHNINYVMLKAYSPFIDNMRYFFERGCFRFRDLQCKEAVMKMLSY